jgi:hypothetical protein
MKPVECACGNEAVWQKWGLDAGTPPEFLCESCVMGALKNVGRGVPFVMRGLP